MGLTAKDEKKENLKCYAYTRVSTIMQIDGYSLDAQLEAINEFVKYNKMNLVRTYSDEGKSGKSIEGRPEFLQMMKDIKAKKDDVAYVVVFKLSRFGRNTADILVSVREMQKYEVNLFSVSDRIDTADDMSGKLILPLLSAISEIERENIRIQTMAGRKQKAREGRWNGGIAPIGYNLINGKLEINKEEAKVIKLIYDKYIKEDYPIAKISRFLRENGYKLPPAKNRQKEFYATSTIRNILDNETYCGKITYGKRKTEEDKETGEKKIVKNDDFLIVDGLHEAIIDEDTWNRVKAKRDKNKGKNWNRDKKDAHIYILSNLVKCPVCGKGMSGMPCKSSKTNKDGERYPTLYYYRCRHKNGVDGYNCTNKRQFNCSKVDKIVAEIIAEIMKNKSVADLIKSKINTGVDTSDIEADIKRIEKNLKTLEKKENQIYDIITSKLDPEDKNYFEKYDMYDKKLDEVLEDKEKAEKALIESRAKKKRLEIDKINEDAIYKILLNFSILYDKCTEEEKRNLMHALIDSIEMNEDEASKRLVKSITLNLPVIYNGKETRVISLLNDDHDETVLLLSKEIIFARDHVQITINTEEFEETKTESKASYEEIKKWILENYGIKMHTQFIAEIKRELGIIERQNYNITKKTPEEFEKTAKHCTEKNRQIIIEALKHFKMI